MKTIKIIAELTLTPESFIEWCEGDLPPTETIWKSYVEKMLWSEFGITRDDGDYEDFLNKTIEIRKLKITTKEV